MFGIALKNTQRSLIELKEGYQRIRQVKIQQYEIPFQENFSFTCSDKQLKSLQGKLQESSLILESRLSSNKEHRELMFAKVLLREWEMCLFWWCKNYFRMFTKNLDWLVDS